MRRRFFIVLIASISLILCLCACELVYESKIGSPAFERMNILVYGNDYSNSLYKGSPTRALYGTVNDATQVGLAFEALAKEAKIECNAYYILGSNSGKKGVRFGQDIPNAIESPDTDTSMSHFKEVIANIAKRSTNKDITVVFVSCHGFYDAAVKEMAEYGKAPMTYFATSSNTGDECVLYSHADFLSDLSAIRGVKLVLADVCHSGGIVQPNYLSINDDEYLDANVANLFFDPQAIAVDPSLFCLSASRYYEQSFEYLSGDSNNRTHGYFTVALLDALGWDGLKFTGEVKAAKQGVLSFNSLASYIKKNDGYSEQNPMYSDSSADIILFTGEF